MCRAGGRPPGPANMRRLTRCRRGVHAACGCRRCRAARQVWCGWLTAPWSRHARRPRRGTHLLRAFDAHLATTPVVYSRPALSCRCANVLYHTARDALDMFRAVVPCRFSDSLAAVPRLAMLLHNDCMYISHHLMTIGHQYRHKCVPRRVSEPWPRVRAAFSSRPDGSVAPAAQVAAAAQSHR